SGTDPSGYGFFSDLFSPITDAWHGIWDSTVGRIAVTVAVAYFTGQWVGDWATSSIWASQGACTASGITTGNIIGGAASGFAGGFVGSNGDFQAGLNGAVSGAMFGWAGGVGDDASFERYGAHAMAGCASGELQGGGCGNGAASAVAGKWATNNIPDGWSREARFAATVVAGGTASVVGGGKFSNGALTASFGYLFNYCSHDGNCTSKLEKALWDWMPGYQIGTCINNGDCTAADWARATAGTAFAFVGGIEAKGAGVGLTELMSYGANATRVGAGEGLISLNMAGRVAADDFAALATNYGAAVQSVTNRAGQVYQRFSVGDVTVSLRNFGNSGTTIQVTNGLVDGIKLRYR
ncbi:MAG: hypothetical protein PHX38_11085, partial [Sulfuricella sp.]|nr:hypothetical protein [Sulfuricella sp.]